MSYSKSQVLIVSEFDKKWFYIFFSIGLNLKPSPVNPYIHYKIKMRYIITTMPVKYKSDLLFNNYMIPVVNEKTLNRTHDC